MTTETREDIETGVVLALIAAVGIVVALGLIYISLWFQAATLKPFLS